MLRSAARFKHLWSAGDKQYVGCWESVPRRYGNALGPVSYANRTPVPKDWVLRGSGIHGPENGEVMKLVLWNRLKQKRPQRQGVTTADLQEFYRMEVTVVWWDVWPRVLRGTPQLVGKEVPHGPRPLPVDGRAHGWHPRRGPLRLVL